MAKWAKITKNHTVVTKKSAGGAHRGEVDFVASDEPVPVTQAQLAALVEAGAGEEVPAPAEKGTDKSGQAVDRPKSGTGAADGKSEGKGETSGAKS